MTKTTLLAAVLVAGAAGVAHAGGSEGSIGVGAEYMIGGSSSVLSGGAGGASLNYDAGKFHVGGFLGISDGEGANNTDISVGGRFFYHVASTAMSDFSVGGSIGLVSIDTRGMPNADRQNLLFIEPGFQIRAFVATNVALSFTGGISIGAVDAGGVLLGAQPTGIAGVHYYFF